MTHAELLAEVDRRMAEREQDTINRVSAIHQAIGNLAADIHKLQAASVDDHKKLAVIENNLKHLSKQVDRFLDAMQGIGLAAKHVQDV
jgi:hypothetical protein